jgi:predicted MPP superfamily phosphohydrolase
LGQLLDFTAILIFAYVQWRITGAALQRGRRLSGWARSAALWGVGLFNAFLATGYVFTFSELLGLFRLPGTLPLLAGALSLAYLMVATAVFFVHQVNAFIRKRLSAPADLSRRRAISAAGSVLMAAPFAVLGYGIFVERTNFRVREIDVPFADLPPDLDGLRILQLTDIHLSPFLSERELARAVDAAIETRPHLAVITGDLISSRGDPLDACIRQLARLRADSGVFACMGNHERYAGAEGYAAAAGVAAGVRFLRRAALRLRFGTATLNLAGVDYQSIFRKHDYLRGVERMVVPGALNVLLSHNPDVYPVASRQGYNLILAGHTHGGQVNVEILDQSLNPARFFTPYVYGLYHTGRAAVYVSRGIGTIGVPARIGAPPEISFLRLRKA